MCIRDRYQLEKLHEELRQAGFPNPSSMEEAVLYAYLLWGEKAMEHMELSLIHISKMISG